MTVLLQERRGPVLWLTIDRPQAANALNAVIRDGLGEALGQAAGDPEVQAVVLTGTGDRVFCAGVDLKNPHGMPDNELADWRAAVVMDSLLAVVRFRKPLLAAVNGVAAGAGAMLALLADQVFAVDGRAALVLSEIDVGLPTFPGLALLTDLAGAALAQDLVLTGRRLSAAQAQDRGLVTAVSGKDLATRTQEAAEALSAKPPTAYAMNKDWLMNRRETALRQAAEESRARRAELLASGEPQAIAAQRR